MNLLNSEIYILTFVIAIVVSALATPLVIALARRYKILDIPGGRKIHDRAIPLWGGLAVFAGTLVGFLFAISYFSQLRIFLTLRSVCALFGLLAGSVIIVITGMLDDIHAYKAKIKLAIQIIVAVILYYSGVSITFFRFPDSYHYLSAPVSIFITIFWIVGITNAINLLDGLDGLLSGVGVISGLLFFAVAVMKGQILVAVLLMALSGACLGFLRYNFNPAKIFLGDTGSLFIGLVFSVVSIMGALKSTATLALFIPIFIMAVPIFDTTFAIIRRFIRKQPIFSADKGHVHHRLLRAGLSQRRTVAVIYALNLIMGLIGLWLVWIYK